MTPRGPLSLPPGGRHWYAVREIGHPDPTTFRATFDVASQWLDVLAQEIEIPPGRTALGGFSQGAVVAYALALARGRPRPAAVLAFSGFMPSVEDFELDLRSPLPPVAIAHGTLDPVIGVEWGRRARDALEQAGAEVIYRESPLPHMIDPRVLDELTGWLAERIDRAVAGPA